MTDDERITALIGEAHVSLSYATALVRAGGRCEYCGTDLLTNRLGYGVGEVDHLLPRTEYLEEVTETPANWVLACSICNSIKGTFDLANDTTIDAESLAARAPRGRPRSKMAPDHRNHAPLGFT